MKKLACVVAVLMTTMFCGAVMAQDGEFDELFDADEDEDADKDADEDADEESDPFEEEDEEEDDKEDDEEVDEEDDSSGGLPPDFKPMVVGAYISMGMAHWIGDVNSGKFRFAGGGGAYFNYYLSPIVALDMGLGFIGKGVRYKDTDAGADTDFKLKLTYLRIPLGIKLNFSGFQAAVQWELAFAIAGKMKIDAENDDREPKIEGDDWDDYDIRRVNMGPRVVLGYAIPLGPVSLVPGASWSMHVISEHKEGDDAARAMNIMFNVAGEFGF